MVKLVFYVPPSHVEQVKTAMFAAGAGKIGNYDSCSWQVKGQGQYRPLQGSAPYLGQTGKVETVEEYLVEMVVEDGHLDAVIKAMKNAHPYEEPAYGAWQLLDI